MGHILMFDRSKVLLLMTNLISNCYGVFRILKASDTPGVPLNHVLSKYSRIDRNIKQVENCLNTIDSSANELDSSADAPMVVR
jgi:hypothetical protein